MRRKHLYLIAAPIFFIIGMLYALLPRNWIESQWGIDPDGGSGLVEFLLVFTPLAIAAGAAALAFRSKLGLAFGERPGSKPIAR
jgi:hypothetical protein